MTIEEFCNKYNIKRYTVTDDGLINSDRKVNLWQMSGYKIPYKFGKVDKDFEISFSLIKTLEGLPEEVGGNLFAVNCGLTELDYLPKKVGGTIDLSFNQLTDVSKLKEMECESFKLDNNKLTDLYSLKGLKGKVSLLSNPVSFYRFETMEEVDTFNTLKVVKNNELYLKRLKYFFSLMNHSFNVDVNNIDKFYKIIE